VLPTQPSFSRQRAEGASPGGATFAKGCQSWGGCQTGKGDTVHIEKSFQKYFEISKRLEWGCRVEAEPEGDSVNY